MEVEQYFFAEEGDPNLINGHHINIYLKDSYIETCKLGCSDHVQIFNKFHQISIKRIKANPKGFLLSQRANSSIRMKQHEWKTCFRSSKRS